MRNNFIILIFLGTISCGQGPMLEGFDAEKWQQDEDGCNRQRLFMVDEIMARKDELIGLNQNEITNVFGKPSRHELYARNKKAFVYFIDGGSACDRIGNLQPGAQSDSSADNKDGKADRLVIRFNGIGRAKEIILYKN